MLGIGGSRGTCRLVALAEEDGEPTGGKAMSAILRGGPYDGTSLNHNDINLYTRLISVGVREFISLPPPDQWDAVRLGEIEKTGPFKGNCHLYELVRTPEGVVGRYDLDGDILSQAMKEDHEGRQAVPTFPPTGRYYRCYRGDPADLPQRTDRHFDVTDEKSRIWLCVAVTWEEGLSGGFTEGIARLGKPSSQKSKVVTLLCGDPSELTTKLSDQLD
jgi:hypothetical protein